ncbi:MAG: Type fimbrial biosis protein PilY1 [Myxococcaceae bacterium]|nr:Type fimbrial biosis protein PilY1 [Myxococcaceae bacterium]
MRHQSTHFSANCSAIVIALATSSVMAACNDSGITCGKNGNGSVEINGVCDCPDGSTWDGVSATCRSSSPAMQGDGGGATVEAGTSWHMDAGRLDAAVDSAVDGSQDSAQPDSSVYACVPVAEVCDGKDNDCDGVVDNSVKDAWLGQACSNGGQGVCNLPGTFGCVSGAKICSAPSTAQPTAELCDGKDNDCDGVVDNGVLNACNGCGTLATPIGTSCSAGIGECAVSGAYACTTAKDATACSAVAKSPSVWYPDCDGDGYAVLEGSVTSCTKPATTGTCMTYTAIRPIGPVATVGSTIDCKDSDPASHPGADFPLFAYGSNDVNCDGIVERQMGVHAIAYSEYGTPPSKPMILPLCGPSQVCDCYVGGPYSCTGSSTQYIDETTVMAESCDNLRHFVSFQQFCR